MLFDHAKMPKFGEMPGISRLKTYKEVLLRSHFSILAK